MTMELRNMIHLSKVSVPSEKPGIANGSELHRFCPLLREDWADCILTFGSQAIIPSNCAAVETSAHSLLF
jgi:hypothetical protein